MARVTAPPKLFEVKQGAHLSVEVFGFDFDDEVEIFVEHLRDDCAASIFLSRSQVEDLVHELQKELGR